MKLPEGTPIPYNIKLSAPAHTALCDKARAAGYISKTTNKGLGQYIDSLQGPWLDTREPELQALHGPEAWLWSLEYPRRVYKISITPSAFRRLHMVAAEFGIGLRYTAPCSVVGAVLEAIGLGFLTPLMEPRKDLKKS